MIQEICVEENKGQGIIEKGLSFLNVCEETETESIKGFSDTHTHTHIQLIKYAH